MFATTGELGRAFDQPRLHWPTLAEGSNGSHLCASFIASFVPASGQDSPWLDYAWFNRVHSKAGKRIMGWISCPETAITSDWRHHQFRWSSAFVFAYTTSSKGLFKCVGKTMCFRRQFTRCLSKTESKTRNSQAVDRITNQVCFKSRHVTTGNDTTVYIHISRATHYRRGIMIDRILVGRLNFCWSSFRLLLFCFFCLGVLFVFFFV